MYRGHLSREDLGLVAPESRSLNIDPGRGGVAWHYAGGPQSVGTDLSGHFRCIKLWQGYQRTHMKDRGWVDIAYTMGACQHGFLLAGRGAGTRTAATGPANNSYYAICAIIGGNEVPTADLLDALIEGTRMLRSSAVKPCGTAVRPHREFMSTACPGDRLAAATRLYDGQQLPATSQGAPMPTPTSERTLFRTTPIMTGDDVRRVQLTLSSLGFDPGGVDGKFGPATDKAVRAFQASRGLTVDGRVGPATQSALFRAPASPPAGPSGTSTPAPPAPAPPAPAPGASRVYAQVEGQPDQYLTDGICARWVSRAEAKRMQVENGLALDVTMVFSSFEDLKNFAGEVVRYGPSHVELRA